MKIVLATGNAGKLREFEALLKGLTIEWVARKVEVEETGATFRENAVLKARAAAQATGEWAMADDSGLEVDALGGRPGVWSARYAGERATDAENNRKLLEELRGTKDRRARYRAVVVLVRPDGSVAATSEGVCEGEILHEPRGTGGFGYDPLFLVAQFGATMAEVPLEQKNGISHRANAIRGLREMLEECAG